MELRNTTVAVTGATGFLGRYIVDALLARGARVVGVVRNPDRVPELREKGVELRRADLGDPQRLAAGFRGADALVSNAALLSLTHFRPSDYVATNLVGTANALEAAAAAQVRRVVQVSSVSVYRGHAQRRVDENHRQYTRATRLRPTNAYALSKALAEQRAWEIARERGLELTAVRPGGIYGAFDRNFMRVFKALLRPPITVYPAFFRLPLVYAGDVAEAIALCLETPVSIGRAYNITGEDSSAWDFARAWKRAGGRSARLMIPIPLPYRRVFDNARAERELGWRNRSQLEGLHETLRLERGGTSVQSFSG